VFALGCSGPSLPVTTDVNVDATSCADSVKSMSFDVVSSNSLFLGTFLYGSNNVVPVPTVTNPNSQTLHITTDLNGVNSGDNVSMIFQAAAFPNASVSVQNIMWYTVPKAQQPASPACPPDHGPVIGTSDLPGIGFHLEVSNPSPDPIVLPNGIEMAQSPTLYPPAELASGGTSEGAPWQVVSPPGIVIAPGSPPMLFDLPDAPDPSTQEVLLRYTSVSGGEHHFVVVGVDMRGGTVKTEPTTWGKVKALYREQK
jgi:hypothetical protein